MIGKAKKLLASFICAALVILAPGAEAQRAFAAVIESDPVPGVPSAGAPAAPAVPAFNLALAPSGLTSYSAGYSAPAAALPMIAAPAALPTAGVTLAAPVMRAALPDSALVPAALPTLLPAAAAGAPADKPGSAAQPAGAVAGKTDGDKTDGPAAIDSTVRYRAHGLLLRMVAALTGEVHSLRPAGDDLTGRSIAAAADRRAVFSDFDETLADSNASFDNKLSPEMVQAIQSVHAAGKTVDVISDRPESVFESMSSLPVADRVGMYVAVDAGGRVYRYDEAGKPVLAYEAPAMSDAVKSVIAEAAAATTSRLEPGTETVARPYTYTIKLKVGSTWEQVRAAGATFQEELAKRGSALTVKARMAKDPANNPYLVVSVNTKANASRFIANARGLAPKDVVILGDGMYAPRAADKSSWISRLGGRVSGRELPDQGNGNDAEMEKGVPGAQTFSVGGTGDPRRRGLVVLGKSGPAASREVLLSVASKPAALSAEVPPPSRLRVFFHELRLGIESFKHYFVDVNVENWREYKEARTASAIVQDGRSPVSDARGFFIDTRMMGMVGGPHIVGSRSGSNQYITDAALDIFDRYFDHSAVTPATRAAFADFVGRAAEYNPLRSGSNLRKQIRKVLHSASLLPADRLQEHFENAMPAGMADASKKFQEERQEQILAAFHAAVADAVAAETPAAADRVVGVVLLGSFATGSATAGSDFDLHVLTNNGSSRRVTAFLANLEKRWSADPNSAAHPINGADFGFLPSRDMLLRIHPDPYIVMGADQRLERNLSPPAGYYDHRTRPSDSAFQSAAWKASNAVLQAATRVDDAKTAAAGKPVESLDEGVRKRAIAGWLVARSLYLAGYILAGAIAYPMLAQALVGSQGYTDLMSLGAVVAILLAPISGLIADKLSFRNTFALNNVIRIGVTLAVPALVLMHAATFWPLLAVALVTSWNVASSMVAEDKMMPALAGADPKRLPVLNAAANINFIGLNVLMGIFLLSGRWVDHFVASFGLLPGLSTVFAISAGLGAVATVIQWLTIPNVALKKSAPAAAAEKAPEGRRNFAIWSGLLAAGAGMYALLHPIFPQFAALPLVGAALIGLAATSDGLRRLWNNPVLRTGSLLSMAYAFVVYPVGSILIPFAARELKGGGALQGQLQGALFFGQLLAGSTMLNLPGKWNTVVRATLLGALGAWMGLYLFPANLAMAAIGMAIASGLYAVSTRLTDRGWMKYSFIGLTSLALPLAFWGNIPALLLGILILGLVNAPNKITIDTVVQREAKLDSANTGRLLGVRSALSSIASAFGYASFGAITAAFHPAFPSALWPMLAMFAGIGALLWMAPKWLGKKLSATNFTVAAPREYSREELAQAVAKRVREGGVRAIITDYDGTLMDKTPDDKAVPASEELASIIANLRRHGVTVVVSTNHFFTGDHNGMTNLLGDRLDAKTRAGMYYAVQSGARIYRYNDDGSIPAEPVWKETSFDDAERAKITPIFEAAAAKIGLAPEDYKIFHEDSRTLIEIRNHMDRDEALYHALADANKANGFGYLVQLKPMPTMRHVPYVQYFKAHKGTGARKAVEILKSEGLLDDESQALVLGDDFKAEGNDLYMAQALPGALAVSVGKTADSRVPNVMQSSIRGAAETRELLTRLNQILDEKAVAK
ncbi:MAG: nucleotidyltransferase domain-containing protein [Elusimicrobiota bacterium]